MNWGHVASHIRLAAIGFSLGLWMTVGAQGAEALSEVLERAIFAEESQGDLDAAMRLYQQVIKDGKASELVAAKAQFRLGQCLAKQGKSAEAAKAFASVIEDYPTVKEVVALAKAQLPQKLDLMAPPWKDGEVLVLKMRLAGGIDIGPHISYVASSKTEDGRAAYIIRNRNFATIANSQSASEVSVDAKTFAPLSSRWNQSILGDVSATYSAHEVKVARKGQDEPTTTPFEDAVYDNEQCIQLMRRLPLSEGYKVSINVMSTLGGALVPMELKVTKKEKVKVPAGEFECYKCELSVKQTFWISTDEHHYVVKFSASGVVAELTDVEYREPHVGKVVKSRMPNGQFTLPVGWHNTPITPRQKGVSHPGWHLLDVTGESLCIAESMEVPASEIAAQRDKDVAEVRELYQTITEVEDPSPPLRDGKPLVTSLLQYNDGTNDRMAYRVYVPADSHVLRFLVVTSPDVFATQRQAFTTMVLSWQASDAASK